jgi:hypothetical protein
MRHATLFLFVAIAGSVLSAQTASASKHDHETVDEAVWRARYSNCEDGFYVILPAGVTAHATKEAGPSQGFAVNVAVPASTTVFNASDSLRFIEVVSYYDLEDHGESSSDTINYYLSLGALSSEKDFVTLGREGSKILGMSAKREQVRWIENGVTVRRDRIIAYRAASGLLYQLTLQSPDKTFAGDELLFNRIVAGFHLSKLPAECKNE